MTFREYLTEESIIFDAKNTKAVQKFLKKYKTSIEDNGKLSVEIDGKDVTIFKGDTVSINNGKVVVKKPFNK